MPQVPARPRRKARDWQPRPLRLAPTGSHSWDDAVGAFLRDAKARNCSPATITGYTGYLTGPRTRVFVDDYGIRSIADVTPEKMRSFQAELMEAGLSAGTAGTFHRVFRNFLGFCSREGYGVPPETLFLSAPYEPVTEPETLSDIGPGLDGLMAVDLVGDPLPDILVIRPGEPRRSPETWATASTGWPSSSADTGGSSPS